MMMRRPDWPRANPKIVPGDDVSQLRESSCPVALLPQARLLMAAGFLTLVLVTLPSLPISEPAAAAQARGALEGRVAFEGGNVPSPTLLENTTDLAGCDRLQSLEDIVVSPDNHGVRDVILSLQGVPPQPGYRPPPARLTLDNRDCRFQPHAAVATRGSQLEALNSDPIFHTVHLYGMRELNLALPPEGSKVVPLARPGLIIVKCDIHGWMQAFVRVDEHPYHTVSAADGSFRIDDIPPGSYTLEVWHERLGQKEIPVQIQAGSVTQVTISFNSPRQESR